jgi:hypothetical protein
MTSAAFPHQRPARVSPRLAKWAARLRSENSRPSHDLYGQPPEAVKPWRVTYDPSLRRPVRTGRRRVKLNGHEPAGSFLQPLQPAFESLPLFGALRQLQAHMGEDFGAMRAIELTLGRRFARLQIRGDGLTIWWLWPVCIVCRSNSLRL